VAIYFYGALGIAVGLKWLQYSIKNKYLYVWRIQVFITQD